MQAEHHKIATIANQTRVCRTSGSVTGHVRFESKRLPFETSMQAKTITNNIRMRGWRRMPPMLG